MGYVAFSDLNNMLDEHLSDTAVFDGALFNYLKVVQHGLTYWANGFEQKKLRTPWGKSTTLLKAYYRLRALRDKRTGQAPMLTSLLVLENGRHMTDAHGKTGSAYYHHLRRSVDASVQTTLLMRPKSPLRGGCDHVVEDLQRSLPVLHLSPHREALMLDIQRVLKQMRASGRFPKESWVYLTSAFHVFFEQFLFWDTLLADRGVETCVFDNHYHNEGLLAALHLHGVRSIEIQHGLIAENDLYYVYPEYVRKVRGRAMFPTDLCLYGQFWKDVVAKGHERDPERMHVIGDYTYLGGQPLPTTDHKQNAVFITAQKNMGDAYIPYLEGLATLLAEKHPKWKLWVKLHPLEKEPERYQALRGVTVYGNEANLLELLAQSRIHISIYSTTFFDAIGLDTLNLSLQNYSSSADYAREMVDNGVALPLAADADPVEVYERTSIADTAFGDRHRFYQPFDPEAFRAVLAGKTETPTA